MQNVFVRYEAGKILTDNGNEFGCELLNEVMGIGRTFMTAYEAHTNAVCEGSYATVNLMLTMCINENQKD